MAGPLELSQWWYRQTDLALNEVCSRVEGITQGESGPCRREQFLERGPSGANTAAAEMRPQSCVESGWHIFVSIMLTWQLNGS